MTRKDYILIAESLSKSYCEIIGESVVLCAFDQVVDNLCMTLKIDNLKFVESKFRDMIYK